MEFINPKEIIDHDAQLLESTYSMAMVCFVYYKKQRAVRGGGRKKFTAAHNAWLEYRCMIAYCIHHSSLASLSTHKG
jgi:hypothetical protein